MGRLIDSFDPSADPAVAVADQQPLEDKFAALAPQQPSDTLAQRFAALAPKAELQPAPAAKAPAPPPDTRGEAAKGFSRGMAELKAIPGEAAAIAGGALKRVAPETGERLFKWGAESITKHDEEAAASPAAVPTYSDIHGVKDVGKYLAGKAGELIPTIGSAIAAEAVGALAGGVVGAGAGTAVEPVGGTVVGGATGAVGGFLANALGRGMVTRYARRLVAEQLAKGVAEDVAVETAKKAAIAAARKWGGHIAAGTMFGTQAAGRGYAEGRAAGYDNPYSAAAAGIATGALTALTGALPSLSRIMGPTAAKQVERALENGRVATALRIAGPAVKVMAQQGGVMAGMSAISALERAYNDPTVSAWDDEHWRGYIDAAITGAAMGLPFGALEGVKGEAARRQKGREAKKPATPPEMPGQEPEAAGAPAEPSPKPSDGSGGAAAHSDQPWFDDLKEGPVVEAPREPSTTSTAPTPESPRVVTDFDVPLTGGVSNDGKTVYIHKDVPRTITLSTGKTVDVHAEIVAHEKAEARHGANKGKDYSAAHYEDANPATHAELQRQGLSEAEIHEYHLQLKPFIDAAAAKQNPQMPPDLMTKPMREGPTNEAPHVAPEAKDNPQAEVVSELPSQQPAAPPPPESADALREPSPAPQVPRDGEPGRDQPQDGGGVRPGEQGQEAAGAGQAQEAVAAAPAPAKAKKARTPIATRLQQMKLVRKVLQGTALSRHEIGRRQSTEQLAELAEVAREVERRVGPMHPIFEQLKEGGVRYYKQTEGDRLAKRRYLKEEIDRAVPKEWIGRGLPLDEWEMKFIGENLLPNEPMALLDWLDKNPWSDRKRAIKAAYDGIMAEREAMAAHDKAEAAERALAPVEEPLPDFVDEHEPPLSKRQVVNPLDLHVGDVFTIDGEHFEVTDLAGDTFTVKDGHEFKLSFAGEDQLEIDAGSLRRPGDESAPEHGAVVGEEPSGRFDESAPAAPALELKAESEAEMQAREKAERDRQRVAEKQAAPMKGDNSGIGTAPVLGEGDLLSGPSAEEQAKAAELGRKPGVMVEQKPAEVIPDTGPAKMESAKTAEVRQMPSSDDARHGYDGHFAVVAAKHQFTLWYRKGSKARDWHYITTLGRDSGEAWTRAQASVARISRGDLTGIAFLGKDQFSFDKIALFTDTFDEGRLLTPEKIALGEQEVGFGKYSGVLVKDLFNVDPDYAEWIVKTASGKRGKQVAEFIEQQPDFMARRDAARVAAGEWSERPEVRKLFGDAKVGVRVSQSGNIILEGETYAIKQAIKDAGGRFADGSWALDVDGARRLEAELAARAGASGGPVGDAPERDPVLAERRRDAEGRPDRSQLRSPVEQLVGPVTQDLLRRGEKFGIPADVITEQIEDVGKVMQAHADGQRMFLLASEPGSGKTFVMGAVIRELAQKLGPKARVVYVTMRKELIDQIKKDLADYGIGNVEFMTYNGMRDAAVKDADLLLFDEAHNIKNASDPDNKQAQAALKWTGRSKFTMFTTATPFENPTQASYLEPTGIFEPFGGFRDWAVAYGATPVSVKVPTPRGEAQVERLIWKRSAVNTQNQKAARQWLYREGAFTARKTRFAPGMVDARMLPAKVDAALAATYNHLSDAFEQQRDNLGSFARCWFVNLQKRLLEAAKIDAAMDHAQDALDRGRFPVIFVETKAERKIDIPDLVRREDEYQREAAAAQARGDSGPSRKDYGLPPPGVVDMLAEFMGNSGTSTIEIPPAEELILKRFGEKKVAIFTGSQTAKQRAEALADWRAGKKKVLVATMAMGGTGLSLHDKVGDHPTTQINVNLPWSATQVTQVSLRTARYGLASKAEMAWLFSNEIPFDASLAGRVGGRMSDMGALVHGDVPKMADALGDFNFEDNPFDAKADGAEPVKVAESAPKAEKAQAPPAAATSQWLRYDPSGDRYNGKRMVRGDVLRAEDGRMMAVDRQHGFTLEADLLDADGKRTNKTISFSVDPTDKSAFMNVEAVGKNIYDAAVPAPADQPRAGTVTPPSPEAARAAAAPEPPVKAPEMPADPAKFAAKLRKLSREELSALAKEYGTRLPTRKGDGQTIREIHEVFDARRKKTEEAVATAKRAAAIAKEPAAKVYEYDATDPLDARRAANSLPPETPERVVTQFERIEEGKSDATVTSAQAAARTGLLRTLDGMADTELATTLRAIYDALINKAPGARPAFPEADAASPYTGRAAAARAAEHRTIVNDWTKRLPNAPQVIVAASDAEAAQYLPSKDASRLEGRQAFTVPNGGPVVLLSHRIPSAKRLGEVYRHEIIGHVALDGLAPTVEARAALRPVYDLIPEADRKATIARARLPADIDWFEVLHEYLAKRQESPTWRMVLRRWVEAARRVLAKVFGVAPSDLPIKTIGDALQAQIDYIQGRRGAAKAEVPGETRFTGTPGRLTPFQRAQVQTPEFKRWFGNSKVVDENGEPLVVYHGTDADPHQIQSFVPRNRADESGLVWLTPDEAYAQKYGTAMPLFVRATKIFDTRRDGEARRLWAEDGHELQQDGLPSWEENNRLALLAREHGYDAVVSSEGDTGTEGIGVLPSQIKSATGNRGTFDPADPRIRYASTPGAAGPEHYDTYDLKGEALTKWRRFANAFPDWWRQRGVKQRIVAAADGVRNLAYGYARQEGNRIRLLVGEPIRRAAMPFVVEAQPDKGPPQMELGIPGAAKPEVQPGLPGAPAAANVPPTTPRPVGKAHIVSEIGKIENAIRQHGDTRERQEALKAARYALEHYDDLVQHVKLYEDTYKAIAALLKTWGVDVNEWEHYMPRNVRTSLWIGDRSPWTFMQRGGGGDMTSPTGQYKERTFQTLGDLYEAGHTTKLDSADAMEHYMRGALQAVYTRQWIWKQGAVKDPGTSKSVMMPLDRSKGLEKGYVKVEIPGTGLSVQVLQGYDRMVRALTQPSALEGGAHILKVTAAGIKQGILALDVFHLARMSYRFAAYNRFGLSGESPFMFRKGAIDRALSVLEYKDADLDLMVKAGEMPQEWADYAKAVRPIVERLLKAGLNANRIDDALAMDAWKGVREWARRYDNPIARGAVGLLSFNNYVFQRVTRSAMLTAAITEVERLMARGMTEQKAIETAARWSNEAFGNIGRQGLVRSRTMQDLMMIGFLAPSWVESMARMEAGAVGGLLASAGLNVPKATQALMAGEGVGAARQALTSDFGTLSGHTILVGSGIMGMVLAAQLINLATMGQPTWQNPGNSPMSAHIPDWLGGSNGYTMDPWSMMMELSHHFISQLEKGQNVTDSLGQIGRNKASPLVHAGIALYSGKDWSGAAHDTDVGRLGLAARQLAPIPIFLGGSTSDKKGSVERQLLASAGIKTTYAPTKDQVLWENAHRWAREHGHQPPNDFTPRAGMTYREVTHALQEGDDADVLNALRELQKNRRDLTTAQLFAYYRRWVRSPLTGSAAAEKEWLKTLPESERADYAELRRNRRKALERLAGLRSRIMAGRDSQS